MTGGGCTGFPGFCWLLRRGLSQASTALRGRAVPVLLPGFFRHPVLHFLPAVLRPVHADVAPGGLGTGATSEAGTVFIPRHERPVPFAFCARRRHI